MFEFYDERMAICNTCEHLRRTLNQCSVCGCFVSLKAAIPTAKCPLDHWRLPTNKTEDESQ